MPPSETEGQSPNDVHYVAQFKNFQLAQLICQLSCLV